MRHGFLDEAPGFEVPSPFAAGADGPRTRPSAHVEAAALRWRERHDGVSE